MEFWLRNSRTEKDTFSTAADIYIIFIYMFVYGIIFFIIKVSRNEGGTLFNEKSQRMKNLNPPWKVYKT